jgi:hypothetical protein
MAEQVLSVQRLLDLMDAGATDNEPVKGVTKRDLILWHDEIERLRTLVMHYRAAMVSIADIVAANRELTDFQK